MFKQRRVPAKARRKTYAWSGDGVGADYDEDEPEERHRASDRVGFDGWHVPVPPGVDPAEPVPEEPPSKKLLLIRNGRRGFGLPEELVERCLAFVTPREPVWKLTSYIASMAYNLYAIEQTQSRKQHTGATA